MILLLDLLAFSVGGIKILRFPFGHYWLRPMRGVTQKMNDHSLRVMGMSSIRDSRGTTHVTAFEWVTARQGKPHYWTLFISLEQNATRRPTYYVHPALCSHACMPYTKKTLFPSTIMEHTLSCHHHQQNRPTTQTSIAIYTNLLKKTINNNALQLFYRNFTARTCLREVLQKRGIPEAVN